MDMIKDEQLIGERREILPALSRIRAHDFSVTRRMLYRCSRTAALQNETLAHHPLVDKKKLG